MPQTITLCSACELGQGSFLQTLAAALPDWTVTTKECMSGCLRPSTVAFRATGKTAYLFGDISEADLALLVRFAGAYSLSPTGEFDDARPFGELRGKAIARIPG